MTPSGLESISSFKFDAFPFTLYDGKLLINFSLIFYSKLTYKLPASLASLDPGIIF